MVVRVRTAGKALAQPTIFGKFVRVDLRLWSVFFSFFGGS
jgi:hypothetical protein